MTEECTLEFGPEGLARLEGELTFDTCTRLYHEMDRHLRAGNALAHIDLAGVGGADSAGLALLLEWQSESRSIGSGFTVSGAPESLVQLARLSEADSLLSLGGREEEST